MSQPNHNSLSSPGVIALLSNSSSLQTSLLADLITNKLGIACEVYSELDDLRDDTSLVVMDCSDMAVSELIRAAKYVHRHQPNLTATLLNAKYDSEHENMLDWPCISGLFYVDSDQEQLVRGLKCLLEGEYWVPRRLLHRFLDKNRKPPVSAKLPKAKLTKRERQILKLIRNGATNGDISVELEVSEHTVKSHLYNVYKKIGVRNRLEAGNWVRDLVNIDSL